MSWEKEVRRFPIPQREEDDAPRRRPRRRARRESGIESWARDLAHAQGWLSRKMNGLGFRSWPDRLFIPPQASAGRLRVARARASFWVEFKKERAEPSAEQDRMIKSLRARGERVHVCSTKEGFLEVFRSYGGD